MVLRVGAAVGVGPDNDERIALLVKAGVDVLVVDTAHGHSKGVLDRIRWIKKHYPQVDVIGGNIATAAAALAMVEHGAGREQKVRPGVGRYSDVGPVVAALRRRTVVGQGQPHRQPVG